MLAYKVLRVILHMSVHNKLACLLFFVLYSTLRHSGSGFVYGSPTWKAFLHAVYLAIYSTIVLLKECPTCVGCLMWMFYS